MGERSFCLVTTFYPPASFGGDAVHVRRLARGLVRRGHRVRVVYNPDAYRLLAPARPDPGVAEDAGVDLVPLALGAAGTAATYLTGRSLGRHTALERLAAGFDVVHFHNPSLLGGPGALGIGDGVRLYTTHEHWLVCPTHVLFRNDSEVCTQRTCVSCTLRHRRPPQPWRATPLLARALRHVHVLLCPSRFTAELHRRHFPETRIEVLPLPAPELPDVPPPPAHPRPFFLYAGRLEPIKGVDRLVRAFRGVQGADLLVAGDGSQAQRLRMLAPPTVRFLGEVRHEEVLRLCAAARAVVVPSAGYETFGGVAVEAMAVGTPAVVRALGPLPELVEHGGGLTFGDDDALVGVLQRLVDDEQAARSLGLQARAAAGTVFGEEPFFTRYLQLVESVVTGARNGVA